LFTDSNSIESVVYLGFVTETEIVYVSSFGQIGWLDARTGRKRREARIGHQILSGWMSHDRLWLQTPSTPLIEINVWDGSYLRSHFIGTYNEVYGRDGANYVIATRYDKPLDVFSLPKMKKTMSIPHGSRWRSAASHRSNKVAVIENLDLSIWDLKERKVVKVKRLPLGEIMDIRFTPDDKQLAISYDQWNGTILYNSDSLKRVAGVRGSLFVPMFAHRRNMVANMGYAVGYYHRPPRLWVPGTERVWEIEPEAPRALSFSPSDRFLAAARRSTVTLYATPSNVRLRD
jgi:WD40 repeat protein